MELHLGHYSTRRLPTRCLVEKTLVPDYRHQDEATIRRDARPLEIDQSLRGAAGGIGTGEDVQDGVAGVGQEFDEEGRQL